MYMYQQRVTWPSCLLAPLKHSLPYEGARERGRLEAKACRLPTAEPLCSHLPLTGAAALLATGPPAISAL